jgi:type I restriction enzyme, S subunit
MNADRLLLHYDTIADAPDAIARLRRFILALAVRGKLVPQDANDEPASELLERLKKERARRERLKSVKRLKLAYGPISLDTDFVLPSKWVKATLGETCDLQTGATPDRNRSEFFGGNIPWLVSGDINRGEIFECKGRITEMGLASSNCKVLPQNCVLIALNGQGKTRATVALLRIPAACNQSLVAIIPLSGSEITPEYVHLSLKARYVAIRELTGMDERRGLNMRLLECFEIAIPPHAEQHRIVAKVDELMALCDRLEAARGSRENARDRLAAASLARLNAPDPDTLQDDARFALNTLPALTTRPDQIAQLRQTILNLAVRGKLVPQDPKDEPIIVALRNAMVRRAALVRAKKIRQKKLDGYDDLAADAELPTSWRIERLGNLVDPENTISYGVLVPGEEVPDGVPFVRAQDLALSSHPERPNKTISPEIEKAYARTRLRGGEVLVCVVGSIGKLGIVPQSWAGANIARAVARIMPIPEISREYLLVVLRGEPVQTYFKETTRTLAQPTLNVGLIEQTPIPLPPLAEQHRIVAKIDELMALCDQLEANLTTTDDTRRRLLEALLAEALAPDEGRELEAAE